MHVMKLFDLSGKSAIVTGAARGLGKHSALALAEAGADVAVCDVLEDQGRRTAAEIESVGVRSRSAVVDVTNVSAVDAFVRDTEAVFGRVDILVNNVGIPSDGRRLEEVSEEFWNTILEANLSSVFYVSRAFVRHVKERGGGGTIINMGSISGLIINNLRPRRIVPYCVSKAGVLQLTKGMASDWTEYGVRVNAIAPGHMRTAQTAYMSGEIADRVLANTPMHRVGDEDELKGTVVYLASDASSFMTGQAIVLDGGMTIW